MSAWVQSHSTSSPQDLVKYIRVKKGDTLYTLAKENKVSPYEIILLNDLKKPYKIYIAQVLMVPPPLIHRVKTGESLIRLAKHYGVPMNDIIALNELRPPYNLWIDQDLYIPRLEGWKPQNPSGGSNNKEKNTRNQGGHASPAVPVSKPNLASPQKTSKPALMEPKTVKTNTPQAPPSNTIRFTWPLRGKITGTFGSQKSGQRNDGINIEAPMGSPIAASADGVVVYVGQKLKSFGNLILIKHSPHYVTAYAHCDAVFVEKDQKVTQGEIIAEVGQSGYVTSPQLHFEIRKDTQPVNPRKYL